jgi:hypothetical protein
MTQPMRQPVDHRATPERQHHPERVNARPRWATSPTARALTLGTATRSGRVPAFRPAVFPTYQPGRRAVRRDRDCPFGTVASASMRSSQTTASTAEEPHWVQERRRPFWPKPTTHNLVDYRATTNPSPQRKQDSYRVSAEPSFSPQARTLRVADGSVRSWLGALTEHREAASTKAVTGVALLK